MVANAGIGILCTTTYDLRPGKPGGFDIIEY
jgi:hypothetical protein